MAVIYENIEGNLVKAYSDQGFYISGGNPVGLYEEAIDPITSGRTYTETDIKIPSEEPTEADYALAGKILLGEVEA